MHAGGVGGFPWDVEDASVGQRASGACKGCHAAKVKCNMRKSGCERCIRLDVECVYADCVPRRAKRRRVVSKGNTTRQKAKAEAEHARLLKDYIPRFEQAWLRERWANACSA